MDVRTGDISHGYEIVIYTVDQVCGGKDYLVSVYSYSGYDVSIGDLQKASDIVETLITTMVFETNSDDVEAWYSAVTFIYNGVGISRGAFLLYGNDNFHSPESYSGGFETWSASFPVKGTTVTGFHAFSSTCDAYGVKIGVGSEGLWSKVSNPFGIACSRSNYSNPHFLE